MQSAHVTHQLGAILRRRALDRKPWLATLRFDTLIGGGSDTASPDAKRLDRLAPLRPLIRP